MHSEIKRWGNSAAVRLSRKLLAAARLEIDSAITIDVEDDRIIIQAAPEDHPGKRLGLPFSEEMLLAGLDPDTAHADEIASPVGGESGD